MTANEAYRRNILGSAIIWCMLGMTFSGLLTQHSAWPLIMVLTMIGISVMMEEYSVTREKVMSIRLSSIRGFRLAWYVTTLVGALPGLILAKVITLLTG